MTDVSGHLKSCGLTLAGETQGVLFLRLLSFLPNNRNPAGDVVAPVALPRRALFHFRQMLHDFVFMKTNVRTAGILAALPAFQIIRGIYRPAFWTGIVLHHLSEPRFVSGCPDSLLRFPQLDPMRHRCLKRSQVFTRILLALAAKVHPFISGAFRHGTHAVTEKTSFFRTASMALQFSNLTLRTLGHYFQSCRLFPRSNIYRAGRAKEPANSSKFFINSLRHRILRTFHFGCLDYTRVEHVVKNINGVFFFGGGHIAA